MNRDLKQFIAINRWLMTTREMAEELGVDIQKVTAILNYNKWQAVSVSDRIRDYLKDNPGADNNEVAKKFDRTPSLVGMLAKEVAKGIVKETGKITVPVVDKPDFTARQLQKMAEELGYGFDAIPRTDRIREAYTQSGSPYGFADELRKIKTK